jgi:hypothetical protein
VWRSETLFSAKHKEKACRGPDKFACFLESLKAQTLITLALSMRCDSERIAFFSFPIVKAAPVYENPGF